MIKIIEKAEIHDLKMGFRHYLLKYRKDLDTEAKRRDEWVKFWNLYSPLISIVEVT